MNSTTTNATTTNLAVIGSFTANNGTSTIINGNLMIGNSSNNGNVYGKETPLQISTSTNDYVQALLQNTSAAGSSSAEFVVANNGSKDGSSYYGGIGINGNGYSNGNQTGELGGETFIESSDSGLDLETLSANTASSSMKFMTNGANIANIRMIILGNGNVGIGTTTPFAMFSVGGNTEVATDSVLAFLVQSATTSNPIIAVSTVGNTSNLVWNGDFEVGTAGWAAKGNPTIGKTSNQAFTGSSSLMIDDTGGTPAVGDGVKYNYNFQASTAYTLSFYAKLDAASTPFVSSTTAPYSTFAAGYNNGSADMDCVLNPSPNNIPLSSTNWNRYSCTFTPGAVNQFFYIRQLDTGTGTGVGIGHKYYIDGVQLETGSSTPTTYKTGTVDFNGAQLQDSVLNSCDLLNTDGSGNVNCGSGLVNGISVIEGSGHSIMRAITQQGNGATSPSTRWMTRLATMLHAQELNHGVDGATAYSNNYGSAPLGGLDTVLQTITVPRNVAQPTGPTAPYLPRNGVGAIMYGINDIATLIPSTGGATAANLVDFKEGMRTIISRYQASALFEENTNNGTCTSSATCVSYTNGTSDTWNLQSTTAYNSGSGLELLTGTTGATPGKLDICLPADLNPTGGVVDLGLNADTYNEPSGYGAIYTTTLDGTTVDVTDSRNLLTAQNTASGPGGASAIGNGRVVETITRRIKVPPGNASGTTGCNSATQHKIEVTLTGLNGQAGFDYYQIEATQPTPTLVFDVLRSPNYSVYGSSYVQPNDADVNTANTVIQNLVSEFGPGVTMVHTDPVLDKNPSDFATNDIHPNDLGHELIAVTAYKALENMPTTAVQGLAGMIQPSSMYFSPTTFAIQSNTGQPTFTISTTPVLPGGLTNLISNPSFEVDTQNWGNNSNSSGFSLARTTTQQYSGNASLNVITTTASGSTVQDGTRYAITLTNGVAYTLSFFAKLDTSSAAFTTLSAGYLNSTPGFSTCSLSSNTVVATGWTRYSCTFTVSSVLVNPNAGIFIGDSNTGTAHNFYLDGVMLQTYGSAVAPPVNTYDEGGGINLIGDVVGPVGFINQSNSTAAFQIQSANGSTTEMNVDTVNNIVSFGSTANASTTVGVGSTTPWGLLSVAPTVAMGNFPHSLQLIYASDNI